MKKFVAIIFIIFYGTYSRCQDFNQFVNLYPHFLLPFYMTDYEGCPYESTDLKKTWERIIDEKYSKNFINGFVPINENEKCFSGYIALSRLHFLEVPFVILLIARDELLTGCGEYIYMAIYDELGAPIDCLLVYGRNDPLSNQSPNGEIGWRQYCTIEDNLIKILRKEYYYINNSKKERKFSHQINYNREYIISRDGHFLLVKEEKLNQ